MVEDLFVLRKNFQIFAMVVLNNNAVAKLTVLQDSIRRSGEADASIRTDWENSGVENLIQTLRDDMNATKQAKLDRLNQQLKEAEALPDSEKAEQLRDRLRWRPTRCWTRRATDWAHRLKR